MITMKELEGGTRSNISSERQFIRDRMHELLSSDDLARAYNWPFMKDEKVVQVAIANEKSLYKARGANEAACVFGRLYGERLYLFKKGEGYV